MKKIIAVLLVGVLVFPNVVFAANMHDDILDWLLILLPTYVEKYGNIVHNYFYNATTSLPATNITAGNLSLEGYNVSADYYIGDGSLLTNVIATIWSGWNGVTNLGDANVSSLNASKIVSGTFDGTYTMTGDLNMSGNQLLEVRNITSPYGNRSYIYFLSDGSIGITLDPIEPDPPKDLTQEEVTITPSTETTCSNGKCNLILYSGIRFVNEDSKWKELWEARSLKDSGISCIVSSDNTHLAECVDFNYTHRKIKTSINQLSVIDKTKVPITVYYEEYNLETDKIDIIEKSKEFYNFELTPNREDWLEASYGDIIKIGDKSTTIKLQTADTENLDDTYIWIGVGGYGTATTLNMQFNQRIYIKFSISTIPSDQTIDNATLSFYKTSSAGSTGTIYSHHVYNHTWTEEILSNIIADSQINQTISDSPSIHWSIGWKSWKVTIPVENEYNSGGKNISFQLNTSTYTPGYASKEYTTDTSLRPYLNITYSALPLVNVVSTLESPANDIIDEDGNITFNCSATATLSVLTNISLYHNITGTWHLNTTNTVTGTSNSTTFTIDNIANRTYFVWNCEARNNATNSSFASNNRSVRVLLSSPKMPKLFVQNLTGAIMWYVNYIGDMWLRGNFTSQNVFLPQYIFSHTDETITVLGANLWTNITVSQEDSDIKQGITHTHNDATNHTFTISEDGIYDVDYDFDIEDTSVGASNIDVVGRLILINGTEVIGSVFETDITKQGAETELSHNFLVSCKAGEQFIFQFIATDADVQISTHGTFGDHPESATMLMMKIANLP